MNNACYRCAAYIQCDGYCQGELGCTEPAVPIVEMEDDSICWGHLIGLIAAVVGGILAILAVAYIKKG